VRALVTSGGPGIRLLLNPLDRRGTLLPARSRFTLLATESPEFSLEDWLPSRSKRQEPSYR
jgi:hypothetical protein